MRGYSRDEIENSLTGSQERATSGARPFRVDRRNHGVRTRGKAGREVRIFQDKDGYWADGSHPDAVSLMASDHSLRLRPRSRGGGSDHPFRSKRAVSETCLHVRPQAYPRLKPDRPQRCVHQMIDRFCLWRSREITHAKTVRVRTAIPALRNFARRFCRQDGNVDDLVHESYKSALINLDGFHEGIRHKSLLLVRATSTQSPITFPGRGLCTSLLGLGMRAAGHLDG